jgi:hypothetical protein
MLHRLDNTFEQRASTCQPIIKAYTDATPHEKRGQTTAAKPRLKDTCLTTAVSHVLCIMQRTPQKRIPDRADPA